jgi:hypothetical protein
MARATSARQLAMAAARNTRNSTASTASAAAAVVPPVVPLPRRTPVAIAQAIVNPTSIDDLNRQILQDKIDQNNALAAQTLQFAAATKLRLINRETSEHENRLPRALGQTLSAVDLSGESLVQSLEYVAFSNKFPRVPKKQLARLFKWPNREYDASEIYKLSISNMFDEKDNNFESKLVDRVMVFNKKRGTRDNYASITIWSTAFL